jgi:ATP-binding cassette subfamily B protein
MPPTLTRQVLASLWPYRGTCGLALVQVALLSGVELLKPWPLKLIIDNILGGQSLPWPLAAWSREMLLLTACAALVGTYVAAGWLTLLHNTTMLRIGHGMVNDLRGTVFSHLEQLSLALYHRYAGGELLYRTTSDTKAMQNLTVDGLFPIFTSVVMLVGMGVLMLRLDWLLTLLALSVCPLLGVTTVVMSRRIDRAATVARQGESALYALVQRALSAMRLIQAYTREAEEHQRFLTASMQSQASIARLVRLQTVYFELVNIIIAMGTGLVVSVGAYYVLAGTLSLGALLVFISYLGSLYRPIRTVSCSLGLIGDGKAGLARVRELLSLERDVLPGKRTLAPGELRGEVRFESVKFGYTPDQPVLRSIDLHVMPGQVVAIVGPTGAGKSTLVHLLPRFFDPQAGRVTLDGTDVREFTLASLRQHIAMVLQPPVVFPRTIGENIAYGRPGAPPQAVEEAARLARIHETIMRLPQRYDTFIGEQGTTLSEGERQRLTIARAIVCDAPILILDEPTSSVDAATEALIMEGLEQLMAGRTTFIIAHRLSTVRRADVIVVMQDGHIVEQGSFAELWRQQGVFTMLCRTQFRWQESLS